jgi:hypothetical protein
MAGKSLNGLCRIFMPSWSAHIGARGGDRAVRNLTHLQSSASSARILNLNAVWRRWGNSRDYKDAPFFENSLLNRSIILKHRLRNNELDLFAGSRGGATKVILPIDVADLRSGGRSFFIGQKHYERALEEVGGTSGYVSPQDKMLLSQLDALPSLDPFLMRERIKTNGFAPARCYFNITEADADRMFQFVRREVTPLIGLSFEDVDVQVNTKTAKLASKILDNAGDTELEPLRQGMGMDKASFEEGIFCWKGFIYYKWSLIDLAPKIRPVTAEIGAIRAHGPVSKDEYAFIVASRARLVKAVALSCATVRSTLKIYNDAYVDMVQNGRPGAFREFLLTAPSLFNDLGERLGAVQHIMSFWTYRFPAGRNTKIAADELHDILADFEMSVNFQTPKSLAA